MSQLGIILQARMGSSRLPGKVLRNIVNKTLLDHILDRLESAQLPYPIIIATSRLTPDDRIVDWAEHRNLTWFRGSEENVLKRYYQCAQKYRLNNILRLTADNPLTDIPELINLINLHLVGKYDYSHSFAQMPLGIGAEIFSFNALRASFLNATKPHHLEHVNEYIYDFRNDFNIGRLAVPEVKCLPNLRLTIDTPEDLDRFQYLFSTSDPLSLTTEEAISRCSSLL